MSYPTQLSYQTLPEAKIGSPQDIERFKEQCLSMHPDWKLELDKSHKGGVKVWRRTVDFSPIDTVRVWCRFKDLNAGDLYDVLHDDVYRTLWDESMIEGIVCLSGRACVRAACERALLRADEPTTFFFFHTVVGYEIERLGPNDDVGYYAAKLPNPVKNRDFCNQRTWYECVTRAR